MSNQLQDSKWYKSCEELPLYNFIKILFTGSLEFLIIDGIPKDKDLDESWNNIYTEYSDLSPNKNSIYLVQLLRELKHLETKIAVIQLIIDSLSIQYLPELCNILREYGFNYDFTPDTMIQDLKGVIAESKQFVVQKGVKEGEYRRFLESNKEGNAKESDYDEILSELSKFQGYHLRSKDLTVSEFCAIFNRYKKQSA